MKFATPEFLWLLIPVIAFIIWHFKKDRPSTILYPDLTRLKQLEDKRTSTLARVSKLLRYLLLILMVIALAKPQKIQTQKEILTQGLDIMLLLDVSGSMRAEDFKPKNRFSVAKQTIDEFILQRTSDRIGLVVFGGDAFTKCPLTLDTQILRRFLSQTEVDSAGQGTAIGMAIATGLNRLKTTQAKSKIMVLLTDGANNSGQIDPLTAAQLAKDLGIKVYTIGVGKKGGAPIPFFHPIHGKIYQRYPNGQLVRTKIDEPMLKQIAQITGAQYFRATDEQSLKQIYNVINKLEKTEIKTKIYHHTTDYFPKLLTLILILLLAEIGLTAFVLGPLL